MEEIIPFIRQGVSQLSNERYLDFPIPPTHSFNFFYEFNDEISPIQLTKAERIDCHVDDNNSNVLKISLTHENLSKLVDQFAAMSKEVMIKYDLVDSYYKANRIIEKMDHDKHDPDRFPEFKHYIDGNGNGIKSFFETYLHPVSLLVSIPNAISNKVVRRFVSKKRDIKNINAFNNFVLSGTLVQKQAIYRQILKDFLITYSELKQILNSQSNCIFNYDYSGIHNVEQIKPVDSLGSLFDCLSRMAQVIINGSNMSSYDVFQSVESIYREFITECRQRKITREGIEAINLYNNGAEIGNILRSLISHQISPNDENGKEIIEHKAKILAVSMLLLSLEGRGFYANQNFELFGMTASPNSSTRNGDYRVYKKENIEVINDQINTFLANAISEIEQKPSSFVGDFSKSQFIQTVSEYNDAIKQKFNLCKKNFEDKFNECIIKYKEQIKGESIPTTLNEKMKYVSNLIAQGIQPALEILHEYNLLKEVKKKYDKMEIYFNLVKWYNATSSLLENEKCLGVVLKNYSIYNYRIRPIIIEIP